MDTSRYLSLLCGGLILCAAGCVLPGEGSRTVKIRPEQRYIDYQQQFQEAYAAPAADGGYDLVLASGTSAHSPAFGSRLYPATPAPLSQLVTIHVAWRPRAAASGDYPAAANSTVDWYVFDNRNEGVYSRYQGIGFVRVHVGERDTLFELRDVRIKPAESAASMRDPLGPSRLSGTIRAQNNAPRVRLLIEDISRRLQPPVAATTAPAAK